MTPVTPVTPVISVIDSLYRLTKSQFDSLFTAIVEPGTVESLAKTAAEGNQHSIDILHNIALRQDEAGKHAERVLFDLFSGRQAGKLGIDEKIQQTSLKLYQIANGVKTCGEGAMQKILLPGRLLYMAGSAMTDATQKEEISHLFINQHSQSQYEQIAEKDLWCSSRMLTSDEINATMKNIAQHVDACIINSALPLINPHSNENMLYDCISEKKIHNDDFLEKPQFFPINTGDHWILFGLYKDKSDNKTIRAIVLNSANALESDVKSKLVDAANLAGVVDDTHFVIIEQNIQDNVPNGCGLFVSEAMGTIVENYDHEPVATLQQCAQSFTQLSAGEQSLFNLQQRRQHYEDSFV